jgi:uncharacterized protein YukE
VSAGGAVLGDSAIPGDPGALEALSGQLRTTAGQVGDIRGRFASRGLGAHWSGQAAEAFSASLNALPSELDKLYSSYTVAADAIGSYARTLSELQGRANWYASQIEEAAGAQQAAQARSDAAARELHTARRAHASATDPASQSSAQRAIDRATSAVAHANSEHDEALNKIASLRAAAVANHDEFESAAQACCSQLDLASHLGIRNSMVRALEHVGGKVLEALASPFVWAGKEAYKWGDHALHDVEKFIHDPSWENLRNILEDAKGPLEVAGAALLVAALVLSVVATAGADAPILVALAEGAAWGVESAGMGIGAVTLAVDGAVTAGDGSEAIFGSGQGQRAARGHLAGDVFDTATDAATLGAGGAGKAELKNLADKASNEAIDYLHTGNSHELGWVTRYEKQYLHMRNLPKVEDPTTIASKLEQMGIHYLGGFDKANLEQLTPGPHAHKPTLFHRIVLPPFETALGID